MMKIIAIISVIVLCASILYLVKWVNDVENRFAESIKEDFVLTKLLYLNIEHHCVTSYYKLTPSDYDNIIAATRDRGFYLTKEEIDLFYERYKRI